MGANDRTGDAAEAFGQLAGPNDRIGPPALAHRRLFQVRGTMTVLIDIIIISFVTEL